MEIEKHINLNPLQAPFYPAEAEKKGASATQYGLVFGIFELVVFLVSHLIYSTLNTGDTTALAPGPSVVVSPAREVIPVSGPDPGSVNYIQELCQFLISGGSALQQDVLTLWRDKLTHYAKIHGQGVIQISISSSY